MKTAEEIIGRVQGKFGEAVSVSELARGQASLVIDAEKWPQVAKWLSEEGGFTFLSDVCGVDWLTRDPRFEVVYNLLNITERARLRVRVPLADTSPPKIRTVSELWPTANWHERETFDMFGIVFEGHPDMRRILMPDEWEGHPLRKDYATGKVPIEYKHLSPGAG